MKYLPKLIAKILSSGLSEAAAGNSLSLDSGGEHSRFDAKWEEALMASMFDENARRVLDYWGPRWR